MIEVQNLSKLYGTSHAVEDVSFQVGKGEILGLLGPNGAGKTTTMRILTGFMAPTSGTARIAGFDILENSLEVRQNIGYLPESAPLYTEMTVRDYLNHMAAIRGVPKSKRNERLEAALDAGKIEDRVDTIIRKLSKGYRQRVGIAQAVIHNPPVLILDEPSAGLDPRQRAETRQFIKSLAKEHTVILSTHILPDVQESCDRVIIINKGKIVAQDTMENLAAIGSDNVSLTLTLKRPSESVLEKLEALPGVTAASAGPEMPEQTFLLEVQADSDLREEVARLCVQEDWGLLELTRSRTTLEDVFLALTTHER